MSLTSTAVGTNGPHHRQVVCFPDLNQRFHEFIHHFRGMMWSGCNPQALLTAGDGRVIDGLHVDVVISHEIVGNLRALLWIADLNKDLTMIEQKQNKSRLSKVKVRKGQSSDQERSR